MRVISIRSIRTEDWLIFLFFFASPTIKSGGELIFLITALFGIGITIRMGFKAWCMQLSRIDIILAVAISTPFFIRLISLSWTEFAQVSTPMAFTNIHYALWPFLLILLRRSEKPVAMMIAGISMASLIGLIWLTVEVVCGYTAELNFLSIGYSLAGQHAGILAQIMCLYIGILAATILFVNCSKWQQVGLIFSFIFSMVIMLGTAKRIQFGILVLIIFYMVLQVVLERPITKMKVIAITFFLTALFFAIVVLAPKFMLAYHEVERYFMNDSKDFAAFNSSVGARLEHYYVGVKAWMVHPWLGYGVGTHPGHLGSYSHDPQNFDFQKLTHFHNQYLQVLVEVGVVGASVAMVALLVILKLQCSNFNKSKYSRILFYVLYITYMLTGLFSIAVGQGLVNSIFIMTNVVIWTQWHGNGNNQIAIKIT